MIGFTHHVRYSHPHSARSGGSALLRSQNFYAEEFAVRLIGQIRLGGTVLEALLGRTTTVTSHVLLKTKVFDLDSSSTSTHSSPTFTCRRQGWCVPVDFLSLARKDRTETWFTGQSCTRGLGRCDTATAAMPHEDSCMHYQCLIQGRERSRAKRSRYPDSTSPVPLLSLA